MYELKRKFKCPYCGSQITMSFFDTERVHHEDCQVCYNTIELRYRVNDDNDLVSFRALTARPQHDPFASEWFS